MSGPTIYSLKFRLGPAREVVIQLHGRVADSLPESAPISKAMWIDIEAGDVIRLGTQYFDVSAVEVFRSTPVVLGDSGKLGDCVKVITGRHWLHEMRGEGPSVCRRPY